MAGGVFLARWLSLRMGASQEVTPVALWNDFPDQESPAAGRWSGVGGNLLLHPCRRGREFLNAVTQLRASRRRDALARLPRPRRPIALYRTLHRFFMGRIPASAGPGDAGRSGSRSSCTGVLARRRGGDDPALHRRALKRPLGAWLAKRQCQHPARWRSSARGPPSLRPHEGSRGNRTLLQATNHLSLERTPDMLRAWLGPSC